mgnify:CR=1 FL=1
MVPEPSSCTVGASSRAGYLVSALLCLGLALGLALLEPASLGARADVNAGNGSTSDLSRSALPLAITVIFGFQHIPDAAGVLQHTLKNPNAPSALTYAWN